MNARLNGCPAPIIEGSPVPHRQAQADLDVLYQKARAKLDEIRGKVGLKPTAAKPGTQDSWQDSGEKHFAHNETHGRPVVAPGCIPYSGKRPSNKWTRLKACIPKIWKTIKVQKTKTKTVCHPACLSCTEVLLDVVMKTGKKVMINGKPVQKLKNTKTTCTACHPGKFLLIQYDKSKAGICKRQQLDPVIRCAAINQDKKGSVTDHDILCTKLDVSSNILMPLEFTNPTKALKFYHKAMDLVRSKSAAGTQTTATRMMTAVCALRKETACLRGKCVSKKHVKCVTVCYPKLASMKHHEWKRKSKSSKGKQKFKSSKGKSRKGKSRKGKSSKGKQKGKSSKGKQKGKSRKKWYPGQWKGKQKCWKSLCNSKYPLCAKYAMMS